MHVRFPIARHIVPVQSGAQDNVFVQKHWYLQFTRAHEPIPVVRMSEALFHDADSLKHGAAEEAEPQLETYKIVWLHGFESDRFARSAVELFAHQASHHDGYAGILLELIELKFHATWLIQIIGVQKPNIFAARQQKTPIAGNGRSAILLAMADNGRAEPFGNGRRLVARTVIYHDHLDRTVVLCQCALDGIVDERRGIVGRNNDADQ